MSTLIEIPNFMATVDSAFPGYYTDVTDRNERRVFSAKANYGLLTEVYQDPRGRYKLYNGNSAKWVTQKDLQRKRRSKKNTPKFYDLRQSKVRSPAARAAA